MKRTNGRGAAATAKALATAPPDAHMFQEMMEKSPINVMRADTNFVIRYINAASKKTLSKLAHLLPCKVDEVVGSSIDIFHKTPAHPRKLLSDERNLPHRALIHLENEVLDLQMQAVHDEKGNYCGAMVTWDVVTEKLRLEAENKEYSDDNTALRKAMTFSVYGPDGTILLVNENFEKMLGYAPGELVGKNASIFVDEATRQTAAYKENWTKLTRGEAQHGEAKRITKDGREIWLQCSYNPIVDSNGAVKKILNYFLDVTQQKLLHADYLGQIAAISKALATIEFNMDGTVISANDNFLKVLGYTLDEIKGKHHSLFVEEAYRQSTDYTEFWAKLRRGEYQAAEYKRIGKGGREVWIQASYNPIFDLNGQPFKVVKYATDITHQKMAVSAMIADAIMLSQAAVPASWPRAPTPASIRATIAR